MEYKPSKQDERKFESEKAKKESDAKRIFKEDIRL